MYCPSCGSSLPPRAKFCLHCGTLNRAYNPNTGPTLSDPNAVPYSNSPQSESPASFDPTLKATPSNTPPQIPSIENVSTLYIPQPTSYVDPQIGSQPSFPPPLTPVGLQGQKSSHRLSAGSAVLIIALVALLIGGSSLIYYATVYRPSIQHAPVTATVVAQINATAVIENPYTHSGKLAFFDPLSDNSKGLSWSQYPINCVFKDRAYHAIAPDSRYWDYCLANATDFSNFVFEVQMQIIKGDYGGVVFRYQYTATAVNFYAWFVGQDGTYYLYMVAETKKGPGYKLLVGGTNVAIKQGLNQTNLLAVVAQGSSIRLYLDHQQIASVTDGTYNHGQIGISASALANSGHPCEVVFSNAKVWKL